MPTFNEETTYIIFVQIVAIRHEPLGKFVCLIFYPATGKRNDMHGECSIPRMANDMTELVAEHRRLLPFCEIFVDHDQLAAQDSFPESIDGHGKISKKYDTVELFG
nr:MAG TPA: hypothetical protein [Caudoviricetes sp.]